MNKSKILNQSLILYISFSFFVSLNISCSVTDSFKKEIEQGPVSISAFSKLNKIQKPLSTEDAIYFKETLEKAYYEYIDTIAHLNLSKELVTLEDFESYFEHNIPNNSQQFRTAILDVIHSTYSSALIEKKKSLEKKIKTISYFSEKIDMLYDLKERIKYANNEINKVDDKRINDFQLISFNAYILDLETTEKNREDLLYEIKENIIPFYVKYCEDMDKSISVFLNSLDDEIYIPSLETKNNAIKTLKKINEIQVTTKLFEQSEVDLSDLGYLYDKFFRYDIERIEKSATTRIALFPIKNKLNNGSRFTNYSHEIYSNLLERLFLMSKNYYSKLISREKMNDIMEEMGYYEDSSTIDPETAAYFGKTEGIDWFIQITVNNFTIDKAIHAEDKIDTISAWIPQDSIEGKIVVKYNEIISDIRVAGKLEIYSARDGSLKSVKNIVKKKELNEFWGEFISGDRRVLNLNIDEKWKRLTISRNRKPILEKEIEKLSNEFMDTVLSSINKELKIDRRIL